MEYEIPTIQAMLTADKPLDLFNSKYSVAKLYTWTKKDILDFFTELKVKAGQDKYGVRDFARAGMPGVVDAINKTLGGNDGIFIDPPMDIKFLGSTTKVYTLFDLVGWILSVTGPVPSNAGRDSFYLPLLCVYCVFWRRLTEDLPVSANGVEVLANKKLMNDATMSQITWFQKDGTTYACLGSNLDCVHKKTPERLKEKQRHVQGYRLEQLRGSEVIPKGDTRITVKTTNTAQYFGHCAETVPFLTVKSNAVGSAKGFALKGPSIIPDEPPASAKYEPEKFVIKDFMPPCENCTYLISDGLKYDVEQFKYENLK